jgi:hypothetical protein
MSLKVKCRRTQDPIYWREKCIDKIVLALGSDKHEVAMAIYLAETIFSVDSFAKRLDRVIKKLSKEFNIEVEIE